MQKKIVFGDYSKVYEKEGRLDGQLIIRNIHSQSNEIKKCMQRRN